MKNNKTLTYVLIAIVGFVWFKVFVRLKDNSSIPETIIASSYQGFSKKISKPANFELQANYADPFRVTRMKADPVPTDLSQVQAPKPKAEKPAPKMVYWPAIKYYGFVKNATQKKTPIALISADGSIYKIRLNDIILDGFELKSLNKNQIVLKYKGEQKTFYKVD